MNYATLPPKHIMLDNNKQSVLSKRIEAPGSAALICLTLAFNEPAATYPVGLHNLGNTCYVNSFLQVIYHIPKIRGIIAGLPQAKNIKMFPNPLKRLFIDMQEYRGPVNTK